ncbi:MAG: hybrid sensor histidine kinase/response regulator [Planctomycetes bacterium]|nr:hybrid sensor histidine kinase/response regulator [Planctomycetota bacterium]
MDIEQLDPETFKLLCETFSAELAERLQIITEDLLKLEKGLKDDLRRKTLDAVFREAHNIKGAARGVGAELVGTIAHLMESLFSVLMQENIDPVPEDIDLCLEAVDNMRGAMSSFSEGIPAGFDVKEFTNRLECAVRKNNTGTALPEKQICIETMAVSGEKEASDNVTGVSVSDTCDNGGEQKQENNIALGTKPDADIIRVAVEKIERITSLSEELLAAKLETEDHLSDMQALRGEVEQLTKTFSHFQSMMRFNGDSLYKNVIDESMNNIAGIKKIANRLQKGIRSVVNEMNSISSSLQNDTRKLRLVPASTLIKSAVRTVRDVARELGKKADIKITGDDIEMDRVVLEHIRDPLIHLLRNAIDHGIETPGERKIANKPETGKLVLTVSSEGNQIVISLEDDGSGINYEKIKSAALKKKIVNQTKLEGMTREEVLDIIFHPGFSSKEIITNISGRGVGLDVVRTNLQRIKGSVRVETAEGKGTKFILRMPLTLSTDHGVLVCSCGQIFAIQATYVERVIEIRPDEIVDVEASQTVLYEGTPIPLRKLSDILEMKAMEPASQESLPVVIVSKGKRKIAFLVEEVMSDREIVIKQLQPPLIAVRNVAGATMTGNGVIVIVLNASDLVDSAFRSGIHSKILISEDEGKVKKEPQILLVDDSITTRTLVRSILENNGYMVTTAVNGKEAWQMIQARSFDLVVTDIQMPVMDGFELTAHIKGNVKFKDIPVIIISSLASESDKKRGIEVGADAYIVKGQFESKALLDVVKQMII